ncbi:MAG TPA: type IX secretion system membrane protein PorP/SprF, partial [Bacteroidetes bacterium]|nr:type IX secretion system membrane protein PorP/SprF [Bacteroidota bacterium]
QVALNPALSGSFEGTARIGGLFREQDFLLHSGQYRSPILFADAPLIRGFRKYDWVGFGIAFQYDEQPFTYGDENFSYNNKLVTSTTIGGLSYHLALDKKRKNVLSIGFQSGNASVSFTDVYLVTPESIQDYIDNPNSDLGKSYPNELPFDKSKKSNNLGYTIGSVFTSRISDTDFLRVGAAVSNINFKKNGAGFSLLNNGSGSIYRRPMRISAFGRYKTELPNGLILEPRVFFQYMQPSWEASGQVLVGLKLKKPVNMVLYGGLGYNPINGMQFLISADVKDLKIVYSFDLNLSDKTAVSGAAAAFELGVSYIIKVYKKPKPDPVLLCPQI